jgi:glycosyltransferase involved in cell wall biosynthesis
MRSSDIVIITDAWYPQINGVVRTLEATRKELIAMGRDVTLITPEHYVTIPCPLYPEIRLSINAWRRLPRMLEALQPRHIHIATEGPLGYSARRYCRARGLRFTSSFHTRFPEYLYEYMRVPLGLSYRALRAFHAPSAALFVATPTLKSDLEARGFTHAALWSRGVDTSVFYPRDEREFLAYPRPIYLYVGRVAPEKNIEAFLSLSLNGTQLVVGDGPQRASLQQAYPQAVFVGAKQGEELARYYAASDVFVFPSKSDTFGLVMLEALACGTPVAAYPVMGPRDVLTDPKVGAMHEDLAVACARALTLDRDACAAYARRFSWSACAARFAELLLPTQAA